MYLLSYIRGDFVYCPVLLVLFTKGRPKKNKTIEDYEKENKRLRMEVALMRDFLQSVERM